MRASLEPRKFYSVVRDALAAKHNLLRVIDESGEDYLYPADYFYALRLPVIGKARFIGGIVSPDEVEAAIAAVESLRISCP